jgi:hypothetical protein
MFLYDDSGQYQLDKVLDFAMHFRDMYLAHPAGVVSKDNSLLDQTEGKEADISGPMVKPILEDRISSPSSCLQSVRV